MKSNIITGFISTIITLSVIGFPITTQAQTVDQINTDAISQTIQHMNKDELNNIVALLSQVLAQLQTQPKNQAVDDQVDGNEGETASEQQTEEERGNTGRDNPEADKSAQYQDISLGIQANEDNPSERTLKLGSNQNPGPEEHLMLGFDIKIDSDRDLDIVEFPVGISLSSDMDLRDAIDTENTYLDINGKKFHNFTLHSDNSLVDGDGIDSSENFHLRFILEDDFKFGSKEYYNYEGELYLAFNDPEDYEDDFKVQAELNRGLLETMVADNLDGSGSLEEVVSGSVTGGVHTILTGRYSNNEEESDEISLDPGARFYDDGEPVESGEYVKHEFWIDDLSQAEASRLQDPQLITRCPVGTNMRAITKSSAESDNSLFSEANYCQSDSSGAIGLFVDDTDSDQWKFTNSTDQPQTVTTKMILKNKDGEIIGQSSDEVTVLPE